MPLEQFQILPIFNIGIFIFSFTNQFVIILLTVLVSFYIFFAIAKISNKEYISFYVLPQVLQIVIENIFSLITSLVIDNIQNIKNKYFIPLVYTIFLFLLSFNILGLVPYSFTITSHIAVTFGFALSLFLGINFIGIKEHKFNFFSLLLPSGTSVLLALLLVPIELISFVFKPISLSIRLFANMMAGHTLLKVIAGFGYSLMGASGSLFLVHIFPLFLLVPLFFLELGVALIQSFVFSILVCIYINDALNLH